MLLSGSTAVLLACVTSLVLWPLEHATTIIYTGCAYRAVVGKEQALLFCLADNLCAMFHCQDNNVFSLPDCGCVPPPSPPGGFESGMKGSGDGGGMVMTTVSSLLSSSSPSSSSMSTLSSSVVLSGGGSIVTSSSLPPPTLSSSSSSSSQHTECQREIHIDGLSATRVGGAGGGQEVYIEPRGVIDQGNGSAYYDGYSYLAVPFYANAVFQQGITVEFVLQEGTFRLRQVLMTNCKDGQGASVQIVMDVKLGVILFHLLYRYTHAANGVETALDVAVPYTPFVAKRVALVFDGQWLTGRVNNSRKSKRAEGNGTYVMATRSKPLTFGNTFCDVDDVYSYRGYIRQISVYRCAKNLPLS